ncbi:MAG: S1C family serine protease, partial [Synergistaceae bacterium]|nr:S1C family serine protease [Synergistaceae bacterium]
PISPGSSGGPVLNMKGEVVGVSTFFLKDSQNLNFAVSSKHLVPFIPLAEKQNPQKLARRVTGGEKEFITKNSKQNQYKIDGQGIPIPGQYGFMGHNWGCGAEEVKSRLPNLKRIKQLEVWDDEITVYSTEKFF